MTPNNHLAREIERGKLEALAMEATVNFAMKMVERVFARHQVELPIQAKPAA